METTAATRDQAISTRYAGQPVRLPLELRARIEASWSGAPVLLYAFADLSPQLELTASWVALGREQVAIARSGELTSFPRARRPADSAPARPARAAARRAGARGAPRRRGRSSGRGMSRRWRSSAIPTASGA